MVSVLVTALLVQRATRRYASLTASLFAALCFLFCPLLLQKLTIAEPDTLITALSFGAFVLWWEGETSGRVTILRWFGCGLLLAALAMAKGPQPTAFFALGVSAYLAIGRRWRDLPGFVLCMIIPAAATIAWGAAVYQPGDEAIWLAYTRLLDRPSFLNYAARSIHNLGSLFLELLPASLMLPFVPWPWQRARSAADVPVVIAPMILYSGVCTAILLLWPGRQHPLCHAHRAVGRGSRRHGLGCAGKIPVCDRQAHHGDDAVPACDLSNRSDRRDHAAVC